MLKKFRQCVFAHAATPRGNNSWCLINEYSNGLIPYLILPCISSRFGIFGVAHLSNHGENVLGILEVVATGLLFCLMIRRTGTLWFAVGFHAAWDWAETFFYGTPDSGLLGVGRFLNTSVQGPSWLTGGSAGPEGSIFAIAVLLLCAALIHLRFPRAVYAETPPPLLLHRAT